MSANKYGELSDELLMLSFQDGDDKAFEELVRRYKLKLFNYILKYTGDIERSEEISQEVFIRVYRSRDRYTVKAKFSTFIYRIALNLAYNEVRDRNRRKTDLQDEFSDKLKEYNTPDRQYEKHEIELIINREINALSPKYRDVILLCDIEGLSYKEVSKVLNISIGTVQSRLSRGRMRLKQRLEHILK